MEYKLPKSFNRVRIISSEITDNSMDKENMEKNLSRFLKQNKIMSPIAYCEQVHGTKIKVINNSGFYKNCDGLITAGECAILIKSADCIPLFFFCKQEGVVGGIHVGRRSLVDQIITKTLSEELKKLSLSPLNLVFFFGSHIRADNYEVKSDVIDSLPSRLGQFIIKKDDRCFFDLTRCLKSELKSIGARGKDIFDCGIDTYHEPRLFSCRRKNKGLFVTLIKKV